jgi:XTP/dITP diphosphohydrolase
MELNVLKIILASANKGKIKEIQAFWPEDEIIPYSEVLGEFEIEETGSSFKENALIKARTIAQKIDDKDAIVLSDDSGISVPIFDNQPGIFSARFAGAGATDGQNRAKLISMLKQEKIKKTSAFYTAAIVAITSAGELCVHGFCHGDVIDEERGENGFGYDFMFVPQGYDKTLGELSSEIKQSLSHRVKGLKLIKKVL